jgi:hypothetical protein
MKATGQLGGGIGELVAKSAIGVGDAVIDAGTGRRGLLAGLELHIIQEGRLGQVTFGYVAGMMKTLPPANKMQQVVSVDSQRGIRHTADILAVQVTIDPADLPAGFVLDHAQRTLGGVRGLRADDVESHAMASSRRE